MNNETKNDKNRPVHEIRYGGIKAVVWRNATSNGVMHNVNFARLYKDGDEWRETIFGLFQRCYSGANMPANPNCAQ